MQRIIIELPVGEWEELTRLAEREHRPLKYQAELIFRDALIERGIIKISEPEPLKKIKRRDLSPAKVTQPT